MDSMKIRPSFDPQRQILGNILPLDSPFTVILDSGDLCNFRCSYCFRGNPTAFDNGYYYRNRVPTWKTFQRSADQLCDFPAPPKTVSLSNHGEPLCNPDLPRMVSYLKKELGLPSRISIHTNASLLNRNTAEALADAGLDKMVVSVQGMSADDYRATCGVSIDFKCLLQQLEYFYSIKTTTEVCIKIVDTALSVPEQEFYDLFSPMADRVFVEKVVPIWGGKNNDICMNKYGRIFPRVECCSLLFHTLVVTSDGTILPCTSLRPFCDLGTVFITTLRKAWNSNDRLDLLHGMLDKGMSKIDLCRYCYIAQNSIYSENDIIDGYRNEIMNRIKI